MTRKEMTNERAQSDVRINSAERGGIGRSQIESLFKTHYTQMYHLALTLLFDEAESKDVVSDVFASLLSGSTIVKADNAKAFLLASVRHRCLNVLQHKQRDAYSWWSYRAAARERNVGWRIDYFVVSDRLRDSIKDAYILPEIMGSDHCPVGLDLLW